MFSWSSAPSKWILVQQCFCTLLSNIWLQRKFWQNGKSWSNSAYLEWRSNNSIWNTPTNAWYYHGRTNVSQVLWKNSTFFEDYCANWCFFLPISFSNSSRCPNFWCNTKFSKKWSGPGEEGYILNPDGTKRVLQISKNSCSDKHSNCALWASWESKECDNNPNYMRVNCPKSCGLCSFGSISGDEL